MSIVEAKDDPFNKSLSWLRMYEKWDLINDIKGGTKAMREMGEKWLPREPREESDQYAIRLARSVMYDCYKTTQKKLQAKPFCRDIVIDKRGLSDKLLSIIEDVDKTNRSLTQFAKEIFGSAIDYGLVHILIDYPITTGISNRGDEKNLRPVFIEVKPENLLGWKTTNDPKTGIPTLTEIRIKECKTEPVGKYGEVEVEYVRVITRDSWTLYKKDTDGNPVVDSSGAYKLGDGNNIGLVTIYFNRIGFLEGDPCMESLAWLNIAHWQSQSDQRNALRFARIGLLFLRGFDEDAAKAVIIAPNRHISNSNVESDVKYVEHTGKSIEVGRQDLLDLEDKMERLGLEPLVEKSGTATATGKTIDQAKSDSDIQEWIRALEAGIEFCFQVAALWTKETIPDTFAVDIFNDFSISSKSPSDMETLIEMKDKGALSTETLIRETKRRGTIAESIDVQEEIDRIDEELKEKPLTKEVVSV